MEGGTFLNERIQKAFGRFVEIRLHTDGQSPQDRESSARNREFQSDRFGTVGLPYYAVLDAPGEQVLWTGAGVLSVEEVLEGLAKAP